MNANESGALVLFCRNEFKEALREEISLRISGEARDSAPPTDGMLVMQGAPARHPALQHPLIFERQRIVNAILIPDNTLKSMAREVARQLLPAITADTACWTCHVFATDVVEGRTLSARARNFEQVLLDFCKERFARIFHRYKPPTEVQREKHVPVLNLCVGRDGLWGAVMLCGSLSDPRPGGIHRMAFDGNAPCRSYLKVEEALDMMEERPQRGETVVDLGASPGGWSYAFLKRGCRVTAVDNGPMRISRPQEHGGFLTHLKQDGVLFQPAGEDIPVNWLVSDMLVSTGKNIGMLKKWFGNRWMRRFIVNIKLPQIHPYPALRPMEDFLMSVPGIRFNIRQLYHDRREVTLFGSCTRA